MSDELRERVSMAISRAMMTHTGSCNRHDSWIAADAAIPLIWNAAIEAAAKFVDDTRDYECDKLANEIRKLAKKGAT